MEVYNSPEIVNDTVTKSYEEAAVHSVDVEAETEEVKEDEV